MSIRKKKLWLLALLGFVVAPLQVVHAQSSWVIENLQAGQLQTALEAKGTGKVVNLTLKGILNEADFRYLREQWRGFPSLYRLDLTQVKVTELPSQALAGHSATMVLHLPQTLQRIGKGAFDRSDYRIYVMGRFPQFAPGAFEGCTVSLGNQNPYYEQIQEQVDRHWASHCILGKENSELVYLNYFESEFMGYDYETDIQEIENPIIRQSLPVCTRRLADFALQDVAVNDLFLPEGVVCYQKKAFHGSKPTTIKRSPQKRNSRMSFHLLSSEPPVLDEGIFDFDRNDSLTQFLRYAQFIVPVGKKAAYLASDKQWNRVPLYEETSGPSSTGVFTYDDPEVVVDEQEQLSLFLGHDSLSFNSVCLTNCCSEVSFFYRVKADTLFMEVREYGDDCKCRDYHRFEGTFALPMLPCYQVVFTNTISRTTQLFRVGQDGTSGVFPAVGADGPDSGWMDLQGRRVAYPTDGVYIHEGKKVILKGGVK